MKDRSKSFGYYHVTVRSPGLGRLLRSNNERAFIISQLQDLLSPRLLLANVPAHKQLASCIDLLAFSVRDSGVDLLLFSIDKLIATECIEHLLHRLAQYQSEYISSKSRWSDSPTVRIRKLTGPHQALEKSVAIHLLHDDWEFDRYSSVGFYLHDRRGDWMRTWRLVKLYENNTEHYTSLMTYTAARPARLRATGLQTVA